MQFQPKTAIFETSEFSVAAPVNPMGSIFTYRPSSKPETLHYHDFLEIGYCEYGSGIFNVNGEPIVFNGQCSSIVYPGQIHIAQSITPENSLWHFLYIDLECLFAEDKDFNISFLKNLKSNNWRLYRFPSILQREDWPEIYGLCAQIMKESAIGTPGSLKLLRALTYALLLKHEESFIPADEIPSNTEHPLLLTMELEKTINFINANYNERITISDLIRVSNMSQSSLQRKMLDYTGRSPLQYVRYVRLKHASVMLLQKGLSIAEIAERTGYTLSSFNRQFLKEFGVPPTQWRKKSPPTRA